jgi:hypothetical protein
MVRAQSADASLCKLLPIDHIHIEELLGAKAGKPSGIATLLRETVAKAK